MEIDATVPATSLDIKSGDPRGPWNHGYGFGHGREVVQNVVMPDHRRHGWSEQNALGFAAAALAASKTNEEVFETSADIRKDLCDDTQSVRKDIGDSRTDTVVGFKEQLATAYQIEGRAQVEAAKNAAAAALQLCEKTHQLSDQATGFFGQSQVEAVKNAAAAALTAATNKAELSAQIAECCCELKQLITAEGVSTRALINQNTVDNLRDQLRATQRLIPVTIPVGA